MTRNELIYERKDTSTCRGLRATLYNPGPEASLSIEHIYCLDDPAEWYVDLDSGVWVEPNDIEAIAMILRNHRAVFTVQQAPTIAAPVPKQ